MRRHQIPRALLLLLAALLASTTTASAAAADTYYAAHLARVAQDAHRDRSQNVVVITNGCLDLTLGDDVIYDDSARQVPFSDGTKCQVASIYRQRIQLTRGSQDLYRDTAGRGYVHTRYCYVYADSEDAILLSDAVIFLNPNERWDLDPA